MYGPLTTMVLYTLLLVQTTNEEFFPEPFGAPVFFFFFFLIIANPPIKRSKNTIDKIPRFFSIKIFIGAPYFFSNQATKKKRMPRAITEAIVKTAKSR